jgi:hypothetical protein
MQRLGVLICVTLAVVGALFTWATTGTAPRDTGAPAPPHAAKAAPLAEAARSGMRTASRSERRVQPPKQAPMTPAKRPPLGSRWTTTKLNVRSAPGQASRLLTVIDRGAKVSVTGEIRGPWAQTSRKHGAAWVQRAYLSSHAPQPTPTPASRSQARGVSGAPCPDGSAVERGLQPNTVKLYRAVCAAFPAVSSWGGRSGSGNHGSGHALDIMCRNSLGNAIARYVRAHAGELGVSEVIWSQRIWTVQRSSEGWRAMPDRGSATANHYDHVHVTLY